MNEKLVPFRSASDARIVGYREGWAERLKGGHSNELQRVREAEYEDHPERRHVRGPQTVHYRTWRAAFDAGYLGVAGHQLKQPHSRAL
jgi:hypothetical protein